jgi:hypothetical protein
MQVSRDAFREVPYLAAEHIGDRTVNLMPLWDGHEWHSWFPYEGRLVKLQMHGLVQGEYLAKHSEASSDLRIRVLEFAWQRASWPEAFPLWRHITDDIHNFATSVAKLEHFFAQRDAVGHGVCAFVQTELEYLLVLARSVFDLLQELISRVWSRRIRLLDPAADSRRKAHPLPLTFSKVVLRRKQHLRSAEDIVADFGVVPSLAAAYASAAGLFATLRQVRDAIVHGGRAVDMIFVTEVGFCVHRDCPLFTGLEIWSDLKKDNENLVALLPLVAHIVSGTIGACDMIVDGLSRDVQFPPEIAPDYHVYLRGFHNEALLRICKVYEGGSRWSGVP